MDASRSNDLGGRLTLHEPSEIVGSQRAMYDSMITAYSPWAEKAGFKMMTPDGRLIGPFRAHTRGHHSCSWRSVGFYVRALRPFHHGA